MTLILSDDLKEKLAREYENLKGWHKKNPSLLVNAYMTIQEKNPELLPLAKKLFPIMPRIIRASQNLKSINIDQSSHIFPLNQGCNLPWISFDSKEARNVLLLDIDHDSGLEMWENLPLNIRPHLVVDPWSGRSAAIFPLKTPILLRDGMGAKPQFFAEICHKMVSDYFQASPLPHGSLTKNPFGRASNVIGTLSRRTPVPTTGIMWEAHQEANTGLCWHTLVGCHSIELRDIVAHFASDYEDYTPPSTKQNFPKKRGDPSYLGRNCYVFDLTRWYCYDHKEKDRSNIQKHAEGVNQSMDKPLPISDIRSISRSIHRYMNTVFNPNDKNPNAKRNQVNRGVMNLKGSDISQKQKQKLSSLRTNDIKTDNTDHKIRQALKHFPSNKKLTQAALSKAAGVSLRTIKSRWPTIKPAP